MGSLSAALRPYSLEDKDEKGYRRRFHEGRRWWSRGIKHLFVSFHLQTPLTVRETWVITMFESWTKINGCVSSTKRKKCKNLAQSEG